MSTKAKAEPFDQVKFLVTCIKYATNGRPDFEQVAKELEIVSKPAAQKRYERLLKANKEGKSAATKASGDEGTPKSTPKKRKPPTGTPTPTKKKPRTPKKEESDEEDAKPARGKKAAMKKEDESDSSPLSDAPESDAEVET